jgi:hypothetical protein
MTSLPLPSNAKYLPPTKYIYYSKMGNKKHRIGSFLIEKKRSSKE